MSRTMKIAALTGAIALSLSASPTAAASSQKLKVVATFSIIGDFARNVGGDRIDLATLVGPDGDAHVYEPKPADAAVVGAADVMLVNGLQFEGFLQRLVQASGTKASVVELTQGVEALAGADHDHDHDDDEHDHDDGDHGHDHAHHDHGDHDPHAWQSVRNAQIYVNNIVDAFCVADAAGCPQYRANAGAYGAKLAALEKDIQAEIARVPKDKRTVIAPHDAFGYFEHAYGIRFLAPQGVSTESEASAADVAALIRQIRQSRASALFVENVSNPRLIEQIASETGLKVGGRLYSDALSGSNGPAGTYIDMMRHNTSTLVKGILGG